MIDGCSVPGSAESAKCLPSRPDGSLLSREGRSTETQQQASDIAAALNAVGSRWALQVVRELLLGPKRFTDFLDGLAGISTNTLAARLRELQRAGVVAQRSLPPPSASVVYELTEYGFELQEVIVSLGRWGARSPARLEALPAMDAKPQPGSVARVARKNGSVPD